MRYLEQELHYMNENLVQESFNRYNDYHHHHHHQPSARLHIYVVVSGFLGVQSPDSSVEQLGEDPVPGGHSASTAGGADGVLPEATLHPAGRS